LPDLPKGEKIRADQVFRVGQGVSPPTVIYRVEPVYTEAARHAGLTGVVVLSAIIRKDGSIEILKVVRGLGLGLDENAVQALRQWKFRPGMRDGIPVDVAINVEVNFSLARHPGHTKNLIQPFKSCG
jgi:protein TonB